MRKRNPEAFHAGEQEPSLDNVFTRLIKNGKIADQLVPFMVQQAEAAGATMTEQDTDALREEVFQLIKERAHNHNVAAYANTPNLSETMFPGEIAYSQEELAELDDRLGELLANMTMRYVQEQGHDLPKGTYKDQPAPEAVADFTIPCTIAEGMKDPAFANPEGMASVLLSDLIDQGFGKADKRVGLRQEEVDNLRLYLIDDLGQVFAESRDPKEQTRGVEMVALKYAGLLRNNEIKLLDDEDEFDMGDFEDPSQAPQVEPPVQRVEGNTPEIARVKPPVSDAFVDDALAAIEGGQFQADDAQASL